MKVLFDLSQNQVSLEGDGPDLLSLLQLVRDIAPKISEIRLITAPAQTTALAIVPKPEIRDNGSNLQRAAPGLREFARAISPSNLSEKIVAIAVYEKRHENRDTFSPKEMGDWFTICGFEKPSQMSVALFDAKRKYGYLDKAGHGFWRLSPAGENLVTRKMEDALAS